MAPGQTRNMNDTSLCSWPSAVLPALLLAAALVGAAGAAPTSSDDKQVEQIRVTTR